MKVELIESYNGGYIVSYNGAMRIYPTLKEAFEAIVYYFRHPHGYGGPEVDVTIKNREE